MKFVLALVLSVMVSTAFAGKEVQNGGGGTTNGDSFQTFGSAKIAVDGEALTANQIPGLRLLTTFLLKMPLTETVRGEILAAVNPSFARTYHRISKDKFDDKTRQKLVAIYAKLLNIPPSQVVIFAVTESKAQRTLLLPEFFELRETEQAAVLLHEALWIVNSSLSYEKVVAVEQAAQSFFEDRFNSYKLIKALYTLGRAVGEPFLPVAPAIMLTYRPESLQNGDWSAVYVPLEDFIGGPEYMDSVLCYTSIPSAATCIRPYSLPLDVRASLGAAAAENPDSLMYMTMSDYVRKADSHLGYHTFVVDIHSANRGNLSMVTYQHRMQLYISLKGADVRQFPVYDFFSIKVGKLTIR